MKADMAEPSGRIGGFVPGRRGLPGGKRYRYWQILSDILADSFYRPVNEWCVRYGKRYTAHLKGKRKSLFFRLAAAVLCTAI